MLFGTYSQTERKNLLWQSIMEKPGAHVVAPFVKGLKHLTEEYTVMIAIAKFSESVRNQFC